MDKNYKKELERALADFVSKVDTAKKNYNQRIDLILKKIDQMKLDQVKRKLNI